MKVTIEFEDVEEFFDWFTYLGPGCSREHVSGEGDE